MTYQADAANPLPACVTDYINQVIRRMRYSRRVRQEVRQELLDHFTDALADCPDSVQRQKLAEALIAGFGDTKMLAALLRRAKKRNRPAWIKALIRTAQAFLLLIALFILYTAWFMTGRPTISTNYLAVLSERLQPKAPESENAWPFYRQAMLRFVPMEPLPVPEPYGPPWTYRWPEPDMDPAGMPDAVRRRWTSGSTRTGPPGSPTLPPVTNFIVGMRTIPWRTFSGRWQRPRPLARARRSNLGPRGRSRTTCSGRTP